MIDRLHVLHAGHIEQPERWIKSGGSDDTAVIPVLCYLLVAADRLILFDTGCSPEVVTDPVAAWGRLSRVYRPLVEPGDVIDQQIRRAGFEPGDITDIVISHLHMDHAGGLSAFGHGQRVWVQRAEYRWGGCPDPHGSGGYFDKDFRIPGLNLNLLDGDASIADGVQAILTDGHTPGHQSLLVRTKSRLRCLVGDAAYNRSLLDKRTTPAVASDVGRYMASLSRLTTLETFWGAELMFSHDPEQAVTLPPTDQPLV